MQAEDQPLTRLTYFLIHLQEQQIAIAAPKCLSQLMSLGRGSCYTREKTIMHVRYLCANLKVPSFRHAFLSIDRHPCYETYTIFFFMLSATELLVYSILLTHLLTEI